MDGWMKYVLMPFWALMHFFAFRSEHWLSGVLNESYQSNLWILVGCDA